ncbi:MAG: DUF4157 domain-containing protein, partial [Planctomycetota bacterium]
CARLGADAFSIQNHIYFAAGAFAAETREGRELVAHQIVHVLQHRTGRTPRAKNQITVVPDCSHLEEEARSLAPWLAGHVERDDALDVLNRTADLSFLGEEDGLVVQLKRRAA